MLAGGGLPAISRLSVYSQARSLAAALRKRCGRDRVLVLFGAGNDEKRNSFPDVHERHLTAAGLLDQFHYGKIPGNKAATKENLARLFNGRRIQCDTLYLFVLGHGEADARKSSDSNTRITLWGYDRGRRQLRGDGGAYLSRTELAAWLKSHIQAERIVVTMTQCHSGGFHGLSVRRRRGRPTLNPMVFGFSATTADLPSQGCSVTLNAGYRGYERDFFAEFLAGSKTIFEAHEAACLSDMTEDVPRTTLDDYLECWCAAIADGALGQGRRRILKAYLRDQSAFQKPQIKSHCEDVWAVLVRERRVLLTALLKEWRKACGNRLLPNDWNAILGRLSRQIENSDSFLKKKETEYWRFRRNRLFRPWVKGMKTNRVLSNREKIIERKIFAPAEVRASSHADARLRIEFDYLTALAHATHDGPGRARELAIYAGKREKRMAKWAIERGLQKILSRLDQALSLIRSAETRYDSLCRQYALARRVKNVESQLAALEVLKSGGEVKALREIGELYAQMRNTLRL